MAKRKTVFFRSIEYIVLLLSLSIMFFFIIPQSDIFLFNRSTSSEWNSLVEYSLNYGNGRFLGNLLGVFFAHHFEFAWIACVCCMFFTIIGTNRLFFKNSINTVFPLALAIVFISSGMFSECYTLFASFTNYFIPITTAVISLNLYRILKKSNKGLAVKAGLSLLLFILSVSACLYSENTTIVSFVLAFLLNIETWLKRKKLTLAGIVYFFGTVVGTATMFLIPVVTATSQKMDHYRAVATSVSDIILTVPGSFIRFAEVFNSFTLLLFCLSAVSITYIYKQETNCKIKNVCISFFLVYPFIAVLPRLFGYQSQMYPTMHLFEAGSAVCYFIFWLLVVFFIMPKEKRLKAIGWSILLLSSIGPMLLVNQYGHRTYLTTYFIMIGMVSYLLKESGLLKNISNLSKQFLNKKVLAIAGCMTFVFTSAYCSIQMAGNYCFYQERTEYIQQEINEGSKEVKVPVLPFVSVSIEDEWPNIIQDIVSDKDTRLMVTVVDSCENADEYKAIFSESFVATMSKAFIHKIQSML